MFDDRWVDWTHPLQIDLNSMTLNWYVFTALGDKKCRKLGNVESMGRSKKKKK